MEEIKSEIDPSPDNVDGAPEELGDIRIEIEDNSFVKMVKDLSQKQIETDKPTKRQLSLDEGKSKKIKVKLKATIRLIIQY